MSVGSFSFPSTAVSGFKLKPFPKWRRPWRLLDCGIFFPLKCSLHFVMVFLDSFSMSSPKPRQGPSPPSVEQILEDLSLAKDDDVVFKSPVLQGDHASLHATRDRTKGKTNISASHSDETGKSCFYLLKKTGGFLLMYKKIKELISQT